LTVKVPFELLNFQRSEVEIMKINYKQMIFGESEESKSVLFGGAWTVVATRDPNLQLSFGLI
jgi:hypothetical protein